MFFLPAFLDAIFSCIDCVKFVNENYIVIVGYKITLLIGLATELANGLANFLNNPLLTLLLLKLPLSRE